MYMYLLLILALTALALYRHVLVVQLTGVQSRDLALLGRVKRVLRLLCSSETPKFNPSKDRSAYIPGASRRRSRRR